MSAEGTQQRPALPLMAAPMRIEAWMVGAGSRAEQVHRTGIGPRRAHSAGRRLRDHEALRPGSGQQRNAGEGMPAVMLMGIAGALDPELRPGSVIVASQLICEDSEAIELPDPAALLSRLRAGGLDARSAPLYSARKLVVGSERARLHEGSGAGGVDMESWWFARELQSPLAVVRVISDAAASGRPRPAAAAAGIWGALSTLKRCAALLAAGTEGPR